MSKNGQFNERGGSPSIFPTLAKISGLLLVGASSYSLSSMAAKAHFENPCPAPSSQALSSVKRLFSAPPAYDYYDTDKIARQYGVTMHDATEAVDTLQDSPANAPGKLPEFIHQANQYLTPYGVRIGIINRQEAEAHNVARPSQRFLDSKAMRQQIISDVSGTMDLPVEYVRSSGAKRITLYYNDSKHYDTAAFVLTGQGQKADTIYDNVAFDGEEDTVAHEVFHLQDRQICGIDGMNNDPSFVALNKGDIYGKKHSGYFSMEDEEFDKQDFCHFQPLVRKEVDNKYVTTEDYSFTSPDEDKATLAQMFFSPYNFDLYLDPERPVIKAKFEHVLAEIYEKQPNVVRYLAGVSTRPAVTTPTFNC